jgi:hypothetical protein
MYQESHEQGIGYSLMICDLLLKDMPKAGAIQTPCDWPIMPWGTLFH